MLRKNLGDLTLLFLLILTLSSFIVLRTIHCLVLFFTTCMAFTIYLSPPEVIMGTFVSCLQIFATSHSDHWNHSSKNHYLLGVMIIRCTPLTLLNFKLHSSLPSVLSEAYINPLVYPYNQSQISHVFSQSVSRVLQFYSSKLLPIVVVLI